MAEEDVPEGLEVRSVWERLAEPFPEDWIEKLPKVLRRDDQDRGLCEAGGRYSADGHGCGKRHARAVHLDYVGHAGITMRLNDVLGPAGWEFAPYAHDSDAMPIISREHFWAKLTVTVDGVSVTKWDMAANYSGPQEALGDALRRCAMRFGVGTYLWSKSDHALNLARVEDDREPEPPPQQQRQGRQQQAPAVPAHVVQVNQALSDIPTPEMKDTIRAWWGHQTNDGNLPPADRLGALTPPQAAWVLEVIQKEYDRAEEAAARETAGAAEEPTLEEPPDPA